MKLLSIDVGIKNLAYCLLEHEPLTNTSTILLWDVINLCGNPALCTTPACKKVAKFVFGAEPHFFCPAHAKKSTYRIPDATLSPKKIKKMKLVDLQEVIKTYSIPLTSTTTKKEDLLKTVLDYMANTMLQSVATTSANDLDLIKLGIALRDGFNQVFAQHLNTIDQIVIENQISPIANRMKTLQGMIAQYFIMNDRSNIKFISAANKLKDLTPTDPTTPINKEKTPSDYAARKKEGIKITHTLISETHPVWLAHFNQHKKKDDLADAFLQGRWVLNNAKKV